MYGIPEGQARRTAERYGLTLCRSFDNAADENYLLLQHKLVTEEEQLDFFSRMMQHEHTIDAVIVMHADSLSTVHYSSQPGKFFSVNGDAENEEKLDEEISGIIETSLGYLCAHEGI